MEGWDAVRADGAIQYSPVELPDMNNQPPGWLRSFFEWLADLLRPVGEFLAAIFEPIGRFLGLSWPVMQWILIGLLVAGALWFLWKLLAPALRPRVRADDAEEIEWVPQREEALALLEDADRLAAEGRYDEATHLLLKRSVHQIASARPDWVEPSSTARELAALPALPDAARMAFGTIATRVERSLFALRSLGAEDWQAAREAYAAFALQRLAGDA
jgi:hypothetical protein